MLFQGCFFGFGSDSMQLSSHTQRKKKPTIHQLTTMLATFKDVLFPGHNHLLTTGIDDLTL